MDSSLPLTVALAATLFAFLLPPRGRSPWEGGPTAAVVPSFVVFEAADFADAAVTASSSEIFLEPLAGLDGFEEEARL